MFRWTNWSKPWTFRNAALFTVKAGALLAVLAVSGSYFAERYRIAFDTQANQCLPGTRIYLVDTYARDLRAGHLAVFMARGLEKLIAQGDPAARPLAPYYKDGTKLVKLVAGISGDRVVVTGDRVTVNGKTVGEGLDLAATLGRQREAFVRDEAVPSGMYWLMGKTRDSFDSRYWGYAAQAQIVGRAYAIF